jgi:hypothetical protein
MENTPARTTHLPKVQWNWIWLKEGEFNYWYEYFSALDSSLVDETRC